MPLREELQWRERTEAQAARLARLLKLGSEFATAIEHCSPPKVLRLPAARALYETSCVGTQTDFPLPSDLPLPVDDGAKHLQGVLLPQISLASTAGGTVDLSKVTAPRTVVYCYPMTGVPGQPLPRGWDLIPGARGCTPQTCGFRNRYPEISALSVVVFGLSTQNSHYQREMATRLELPFEILSDSEFKLCDALHLPTFEVDGKRLMKRLTLIVRDARIEHVFYPVFPPNESADEVLHWLKLHPVSI